MISANLYSAAAPAEPRGRWHSVPRPQCAGPECVMWMPADQPRVDGFGRDGAFQGNGGIQVSECCHRGRVRIVVRGTYTACMEVLSRCRVEVYALLKLTHFRRQGRLIPHR